MSYEEEDTCMSSEQEDTCTWYEEEDTCLRRRTRDSIRHPAVNVLPVPGYMHVI